MMMMCMTYIFVLVLEPSLLLFAALVHELLLPLHFALEEAECIHHVLVALVVSVPQALIHLHLLS